MRMSKQRRTSTAITRRRRRCHRNPRSRSIPKNVQGSVTPHEDVETEENLDGDYATPAATPPQSPIPVDTEPERLPKFVLPRRHGCDDVSPEPERLPMSASQASQAKAAAASPAATHLGLKSNIWRVGTPHPQARATSADRAIGQMAARTTVAPQAGTNDGVRVPRWLQQCASEAMEDARIQACSKQELTKLFAADRKAITKPKVTIAFCQTCLGRGFQLKLSLPVNLALAWAWGQSCKFFLVVFDAQNPDTQDLLAWIHAHLRPALQCGFLNVCIGDMNFWDCSIGKNTAHVFAMETLKGQGCDEPYLVNLDGDNIIKEEWLPWLFDLLNREKIGLHMFGGMDAGCTGRVGVWKSTFVAINGYEESLPFPSGYEEIEISHRSNVLHGNCAMKYNKRKKSYPGCGYSIPNDDNLHVALNQAKVANCDAQRCGTLSWGKQNAKNISYCKNLKGRRILDCATSWKFLFFSTIWRNR